MPFSKSEKYKVRLALQSCKNVDELVDLLNTIQFVLAKSKTNKYPLTLITEKAIKYYLYSSKTKYRTFTIPKRSGGKREISAPDVYLRMVQRLIKTCLEAIFTPNINATGFVKGRNIVTNAQMHVGKKYVYNIDLKNFFPSITFFRVWAVLEKVYPFRLNKETARIIANLCCHEGKLPQGAPTSPLLSNAICIRLDKRLTKLAEKHQANYTRYADDITVSSNNNIFSDRFKSLIREIIESEGFALNEKKERLQRYNVKDKNGDWIRERQVVTGITVNDKTSISKSYTRNLRAIIHNWTKNGYKSTNESFQKYYMKEQGYVRREYNIPPLALYVSGKLEYLGMVIGKKHDTYTLLKLQFDSLCEKENYSDSDLQEILDIWKTEGIDNAITKFYNIKNLLEKTGELKERKKSFVLSKNQMEKIEVKTLNELAGLKNPIITFTL